jgi:hypothetical protein
MGSTLRHDPGSPSQRARTRPGRLGHCAMLRKKAEPVVASAAGRSCRASHSLSGAAGPAGDMSDGRLDASRGGTERKETTEETGAGRTTT